MKTLTSVAFIHLGSNIKPEYNLPRAYEELKRIFTIEGTSRIYQSPPIKKDNANFYLNAAVKIETDTQPAELKWNYLRKLESKMGRVRTEDKYKPRRIDLDLVLYDQLVTNDDEHGIVLPDPEITKYAHVCLPLAEIDPNFIHPVHGVSLKTIANKFQKNSSVSLRGSFDDVIATH